MNKYTGLFFDSFLKCPPEYKGIIKSFAIIDAHKKAYPLVEDNRAKDCFFNGLIFKDRKVFVFNISIFNQDNNYKSEYLDITTVFNKHLTKRNIILLSMMINKSLHTFYRESVIAENLIYNLQNVEVSQRQTLINKQKNREKPFIRNNSSNNAQEWFLRIDTILRKKETKSVLSAKDVHKTAFNMIQYAPKNSIL